MLGIVVSPAMATLGPQLRSAAPGPEPRRTPGAASAAWGSAGARWGSSRPAGPARDGWQARSPAGKDVTLPSPARPPAQPLLDRWVRPPEGSGPECRVGTRAMSALLCEGSCPHSGTRRGQNTGAEGRSARGTRAVCPGPLLLLISRDKHDDVLWSLFKAVGQL